ncbi:MAG: heparan-alpha-glucosaminide N-acetyltransferase domain-containing protein [Saprospiraceae bacterium]|nr:heparan-alpha-glucosaminide N-acetyltransferase domain-containing protein [Saprospiraceae bacterium]
MGFIVTTQTIKANKAIMTNIKSSRIISLDVLRGIIMVIMALDHVRDYFNYGSFFVDPSNIETTNPALFFTRFITHFCAPIFIFLAGTSAFLYREMKTKKELATFLLTRGLWLILLERGVNNLIWTFDITYSLKIFQVIWAIGMCMVILSALIYLNKNVLLVLGLILIFLHNTLDGFTMTGNSPEAILWYLLHQDQAIVLHENSIIFFHYPLMPLIGVISMGYLFGELYSSGFDVIKRKKWLLGLGLGLLSLFLIVRGINIYGDLLPWKNYETTTKTVMSFLNVTKYPMSLLYLSLTLGIAFLALYFLEGIQNKFTQFFLVFGRVPLFYYFMHMLVIHITAIIGILFFGGNWTEMILTAKSFLAEDLKDYGYPLYVVYGIWAFVILILYLPCKKYMIYKANNRDKWWLSYL